MTGKRAAGKKTKKSGAKKVSRYQRDAAYRRATQILARERYHKDAKYHRATLARAKKRYHEDAEYRRATIERAKKRYRRLKRMSQRLSLTTSSSSPAPAPPRTGSPSR
jgi:hypothetical protein